MNVSIANPNSKGQFVIPKSIRSKLGIDESTPLKIEVQGQKIVLAKVTDVFTADSQPSRQAYLALLKQTQGTWSDKDYEDYQAMRTKEKAALESPEKQW